MGLETVRKLTADNADLESQTRSAMNAYKIYDRTRPDPSSQSMVRAKKLPKDLVHPLLSHMCNDAEVDLMSVRSQIRNFRPSLTVFEVDAAKRGQHRPLYMLEKRAAHGDKIFSTDRGKVKMKGKAEDVDEAVNEGVMPPSSPFTAKSNPPRNDECQGRAPCKVGKLTVRRKARIFAR